MDFKHDLSRLFPRHRKESLQHDDDEFHGRVVVVQQNDLEQRWRLELGFLGLEQSAFSHTRRHTPINLCQKHRPVKPPPARFARKLSRTRKKPSITKQPFGTVAPPAATMPIQPQTYR